MIAAYQGTSAVSRAIRWQTRSRYSHVGWLLPDWTIIEAWHRGGVRHNTTPWEQHTPGTRVDVFEISGLTREQLRAIEVFLSDQLGRGYDWLGVLRFLSRRGGGSRDRWFCSELVFAACQFVHIDLLRDTQPWEVSPGLLVRSPLLTQIGMFVRPEQTVRHRRPVFA